jgi:hypothetical protein
VGEGLVPSKEIVEAAIRRRDEIRRILRPYYELVEAELPEMEKRIRPLPGGGGPIEHAAEDGGHDVRELEAYVLYVVHAWASCYKPSGDGFRSCGEEAAADVGVVLPTAYHEERIKVYRETLEAWVSRRILKRMDGGVLLWDGSLRPVVIRHWPGAGETGKGFERLLSDAAKKLGYHRLGGIDDMLADMMREHERVPLAAQRMVLTKLGPEKLQGEDAKWVSLLEWFEKMAAVKLMLEDAWNRGVTPVFITKTSRSTSLFDKALPDVYYLRILRPVEAFMTHGAVLRTVKEMRGFPPSERIRGPLFPENLGLNSFYMENVGLIEFYARLSRGSPILKIEIAFDLGEVGWDPGEDYVEESINRVIEALLSIPQSGGYPLPLKVAHERGRVRREDMDRVLSALGLALERSGRVMLE